MKGEGKKKSSGGIGMVLDKETKIVLFVCIAGFLFAGVLHLLDVNFPHLPLRLRAVSYVFYIGFCLMMTIYLYTDVPNRYARRWLISMISVILAWQVMHIYEECIFLFGSGGERFMWYLYYIPMMLSLNFFLFGALYSKLPENKPINRNWFWTLAGTAVFTVLGLTNDFHQLILTFPLGKENFYIEYGHGIVYYAMHVWVFFLAAMVIFTMYKTTRARGARKGVIVLVVVFGLSLLYFIWWIVGQTIFPGLIYMYDVQEAIGFFLILALEMFVRVGFIRTNFNYLDFFRASTVAVGVDDSNNELRYISAGGKGYLLTQEQKNMALEDSFYLNDDIRVTGTMIKGGFAYWSEDLGPINRVSRELEETNKKLEQENDLIRAENDMKARRTKAQVQNRLYDDLAKELEPEFDAIVSLVGESDTDDPDFKRRLARACVYKAYIKRYSNLVIISRENDMMNIYELTSSLRESLDVIGLNGIECDLQINANGTYKSQALIDIYIRFQEVIEPRINIIEKIVITVNDGTYRPEVEMRIKGPKIPGEDEKWLLSI